MSPRKCSCKYAMFTHDFNLVHVVDRGESEKKNRITFFEDIMTPSYLYFNDKQNCFERSW